MKQTEIMQKSDQELTALVIDTRKALAEAVIESQTKQITNVKQFAAHKRTIARALTIQRQRALQEETK